MNLPQRTAGETKIGETTVWVKTLNDPERREANDEASVFAATAVRRFRPGRDGYHALCDEFADRSDADCVLYLAEAIYFLDNVYGDAHSAYGEQPRPERGEQNEDEFAEALEAWETAREEAAQSRVAFVQARYNAAKADAECLSADALREKCVTIARRRKQSEIFSERVALETLLRAVRHAHAHSDKFFDRIEQIADLSNVSALVQFYASLDTVSPTEIPPSPDNS